MNKMTKRLLWLPLTVALASCADTNELYPGNAYAQYGVIINRYHEWPETMKGLEASTTITITNEEHGYFNGKNVLDADRKLEDCYGFEQAKSWHPEYFKNEAGKDLYWLDPNTYSDIINHGIGTYADQSSLYETVYSQNKKLSRIHSGFSKGYLSKLYNGQIRCNAWAFYAMVFLDQEGYGTFFPAELNNAKYFAFVARGGRDSNDSRIGNMVSFDIVVTFYRYKEDGKTLMANEVVLDNVKLQANKSAEITSLVGFTFEDVGISPKGIIGMSMKMTELDDPYRDEDNNIPSMDFTDNAKIHTGLGLYEVLLPDSTWY